MVRMNVLERLKKRTGEIDDALLDDLLESAKASILDRRYPYGDGTETLESKYEDLQLRIAIDLYSKLGGEGQISHSENGINRSWASANISPEWLNEIVPMCGGLK